MMRLERCSTNALRDGQGVDRSGYHCSVYRAADVDILLANIRLALATERKATGIGATVGSGGVIYSKVAIRDARAALDALLADGGA